MDLNRYYQEIADRVISLRASGLALSADDDEYLHCWYEAGLGIDVVLGAIEEEAARNARARRPVKTLRLRAVDKRLQKRVSSSARVAGVHHETMAESLATADQETTEQLASLARLYADLGEMGGDDQQSMDELEQLMERVKEGLSALRVRARLAGIARAWRGNQVDNLDDATRTELEAEILNEVGNSLKRMTAQARSDTMRELLGRKLASRGDPFQEVV